MTGKELLFAALRNEETSRPAWVPFVGVHGGQIIGVSAKDYLQQRDLLVQGLLKAAELYRPDGLPIVFDLQMEAELLGCDLNWADDGPPAVCSHPLELGKLEDIPAYSTDRGRFPMVAEAIKEVKAKIGNDVALYGLITGPFTLALHLMGNTIFLEMYDNPDKIEAVLKLSTEIGKQTADFYIDNGCDVIAVVDPMTSQISPEHFEQYVTPYVNAVFDHVRQRGAFSSLFVCGDATRNLQVMAQTTCDNISVDENISLEALKEIAGRYNKSIGGNLKLTLVLLLGNEVDSKIDAVRCIETCGTKGFVLAPGCDLPWGVPEKNLQAVAEMVFDEYQREAAKALKSQAMESFDDVVLPDYATANDVYVDVITLDSTSCAPCQYMMAAAEKAAASIGAGVIVREHKVKNRLGIGHMVKLGVQNIPTICIDGKAEFISIIPDQNTLAKVIGAKVDAKK